MIVDKIQNLSTPTTKTQAQHVIGMFGYWRQYIPYLQLILQPLYKITRKSEAFDWGTEQKEAFDIVIQYIKDFQQLAYIGPNDCVYIEVLYLKGYGN